MSEKAKEESIDKWISPPKISLPKVSSPKIPPPKRKIKTAEELLKENPITGKLAREIKEIERKYEERKRKNNGH